MTSAPDRSKRHRQPWPRFARCSARPVSNDLVKTAEVTLFSDGITIYACHGPDEIIDLLHQDQGVFGITLGSRDARDHRHHPSIPRPNASLRPRS